jgi:hypothetical protein
VGIFSPHPKLTSIYDIHIIILISQSRDLDCPPVITVGEKPFQLGDIDVIVLAGFIDRGDIF